jgi:hypothetical protein
MEVVATWFAEQGVFGMIILALGYGFVRLWNQKDELQEKRVAESRESIKAIEQNTNTLDTMTEVLRERGK